MGTPFSTTFDQAHLTSVANRDELATFRAHRAFVPPVHPQQAQEEAELRFHVPGRSLANTALSPGDWTACDDLAEYHSSV